jgi:hypothetical protein
MDNPPFSPPAHQGDTYDLVDQSAPAAPAPVAAPVSAAPAAAPAPQAVAATANGHGQGRPGLMGGLMGRLAARLVPPSPAPAETARRAPSDGPRLRRISRPARTLRFTAPAWVVSMLVHVGILSALGLASLSPEVRKAVANINASMVDTSLSKQQAEELTTILGEPTSAPRSEAISEFLTTTPGLGGGLGTGSGPPSATPRVPVASAVNERTSMPSVNVVPKLSGLAIKPPTVALSREIGGGIGGAAIGEVARPTKDIGQALDQVAREILRHLEKHKLTVVWLFDESGSMKDDQKAVKEKFNRVSAELKLNLDENKKSAGALLHAIVGFGQDIHYDVKPTADIDLIAKAIDRLRVDESGVENTCHAIADVINTYSSQITKDRRLLIVLVTDESGDDGAYVEEARQRAVKFSVPIYVIGRQSMFGKWSVILPYKDPLTGDTYWPSIRRGPETAGLEVLQWDGLHGRWDEQPSGFAPYELARLTKETGGIYFILPSEEYLRSTQREKAYSMASMKEYVPDYESRVQYNTRVARSPFRRALFEIITQTKDYGFRYHYPVEPGPMMQAIAEELPKVNERLAMLGVIEKRLKSLAKDREHEPDKRWQAHYDLMLAQIVAYQIKAYEYRACLAEMVQLAQAGKLQPSKPPVPGQLIIEWQMDHSQQQKAPKEETEKKRAEAKALLEGVIQRHPNTPWADLAQDELNRGFGCQRNEWHHSPKYDERASLVPKY